MYTLEDLLYIQCSQAEKGLLVINILEQENLKNIYFENHFGLLKIFFDSGKDILANESSGHCFLNSRGHGSVLTTNIELRRRLIKLIFSEPANSEAK